MTATPLVIQVAPPPTWILNPLLRVYDAANGTQLLELDDRNGRTARFSLTTDAIQLLSRFRDGCSWPIYRAELVDSGVDASRLETIGAFLAGPCRDKRILIEPSEAAVASDLPTKPAYLTVMIEIIPYRVVNAISSLLQRLFSPSALTVGVCAIVAAMAYMFVTMSTTIGDPMLNARSTLTVGIIAAIGVVLHELGHAAAAYRLGARRVSIGLGWYLVIPVAYSELSELWRYPRRSRAVVNFAGIYMQGLIVVAMMLLFQIAHDPTWLVCAVATSTSILWNLNPFLRMDGYWVVADALDCHDLRQRAGLQLSSAVRRLFAKERLLDSGISWAILGYATLSAAFLGWLLFRAIGFLATTLMLALPTALHRIAQFSFADFDFASWSLAFVALVWQLILVYIAARYLASIPTRLSTWWRKGDLQRSRIT